MQDQQWKIDREAARRRRHIPTLFEVRQAESLAAPPAPPTPEEQERAVIASALREVRDRAMAAGITAGLAVGRTLERNRR